ncbi:hypothetical protein OAL43_00965 [bacterium]|nr:hypothetical protein [bacterium]
MSFSKAVLQNGESRLQREFSDFAVLWREVRDHWKDERRNQFENRHLKTLGPSLERFSTSLRDLSESIAQATNDLRDDH